MKEEIDEAHSVALYEEEPPNHLALLLKDNDSKTTPNHSLSSLVLEEETTVCSSDQQNDDNDNHRQQQQQQQQELSQAQDLDKEEDEDNNIDLLGPLNDVVVLDKNVVESTDVVGQFPPPRKKRSNLRRSASLCLNNNNGRMLRSSLSLPPSAIRKGDGPRPIYQKRVSFSRVLSSFLQSDESSESSVDFSDLMGGMDDDDDENEDNDAGAMQSHFIFESSLHETQSGNMVSNLKEEEESIKDDSWVGSISMISSEQQQPHKVIVPTRDQLTRRHSTGNFSAQDSTFSGWNAMADFSFGGLTDDDDDDDDYREWKNNVSPENNNSSQNITNPDKDNENHYPTNNQIPNDNDKTSEPPDRRRFMDGLNIFKRSSSRSTADSAVDDISGGREPPCLATKKQKNHLARWRFAVHSMLRRWFPQKTKTKQ